MLRANYKNLNRGWVCWMTVAVALALSAGNSSAQDKAPRAGDVIKKLIGKDEIGNLISKDMSIKKKFEPQFGILGSKAASVSFDVYQESPDTVKLIPSADHVTRKYTINLAVVRYESASEMHRMLATAKSFNKSKPSFQPWEETGYRVDGERGGASEGFRHELICGKARWAICLDVFVVGRPPDPNNAQRARDMATGVANHTVAKMRELGLWSAETVKTSNLAVDILDANPAYLKPKTVVPFNQKKLIYLVHRDYPFDSRRLRKFESQYDSVGIKRIRERVVKTLSHGLEHTPPSRVGAVTDGESRLLLRARTEKAGKVRFELENPGKNGKIEPLFGEQAIWSEFDFYYAYALYTPPDSFGDSKPVSHRNVNVRVRFQPNSGNGAKTTIKKLRLERPPVVLVHGTYDDPDNCWAAKKKTKHKEYVEGIKAKLEKNGMKVFLVDYRSSNGKALEDDDEAEVLGGGKWAVSNHSHFRDNAKVVWYGGKLAYPRVPNESSTDDFTKDGIEDALCIFRNKRKVAATQADVVGHSMGGVLARVYAKGKHLNSDCKHSRREEENEIEVWQDGYLKSFGCRPSVWEASSWKIDWYRRADNFYQGDINRLITIGSTHLGSDVARVLEKYPGHARAHPGNPRHEFFEQMARPGGMTLNEMRWWIIYLSTEQLLFGAFSDQIPDSKALSDLGPTDVPAHAIGCVAKESDLDLFVEDSKAFKKGLDKLGLMERRGIYREQMFLLYTLSPKYSILFGEGTTDTKALEMLQGQMSEKRSMADFGAYAHSGSLDLWLKWKPKFEELRAEEAQLHEAAQIAFLKAAFNHDWTDYTVSLQSQLAGFAVDDRHVTVLPKDYANQNTPGILHTYEPRHRLVQERVIELLLGDMQPFCKNGFPAPYDPAKPPASRRYQPPSPGTTSVKDRDKDVSVGSSSGEPTHEILNLKVGDQFSTSNRPMQMLLSSRGTHAAPTTVELGPRSKLRVLQHSQSENAQRIELQNGALHAFTRHDAPHPEHEIQAGKAVVTLKGTDVIVTYDAKKDTSRILLQQGLVGVETASGNIELQPGQLVIVHGDSIGEPTVLNQDDWNSAVAESSLEQLEFGEDTQVVAGSPWQRWRMLLIIGASILCIVTSTVGVLKVKAFRAGSMRTSKCSDVKTCSQCEAKLTPASKFCNKCGTRRCPSCGATARTESAKFCRCCRELLNSSSESPSEKDRDFLQHPFESSSVLEIKS